jgi:DNA-binding transcriptional regulator GbsR (MarR family)
MAKTSAQTAAAKRDFVERLAVCSEEDGMPRIAGRLLAFLMVHDGAYSLDELAEALQASKASVSTNARLLEERGVLLRGGSPGDRRDFYQIAPAPWQNVIVNARRKVQKFKETVDDTLQALPASETGPRRRLREAALFYEFVMDDLRELQSRWANVLRAAEESGLHEEAGAAKAKDRR